MSRRYPAIADPRPNIDSILDAVVSIKQNVEMLNGVRDLISRTADTAATTSTTTGIALTRFVEQATPATPPSGIVLVYAKSDHKLYSLGSDGVEHELSARAFA